MRLMLGNQEDVIRFDDLDCVTKRLNYQTSVLARYCANCGAESVGAIIHVEETLSYNELRDRFGQDSMRERQNELKRGREISKKMFDTVFHCLNCPLCGTPFPEKTKKGFFLYEENFSSHRYFMMNSSDTDKLFKKMADDRVETLKNEAADAVTELTEKANEKYHKADALIPKTAEITASTQTLLPYIGHLMRLEVGLYAVQQNLVELYKGKTELRAALLEGFQWKIGQLKPELDLWTQNLKRFEEEHDAFVSVSKPEIVYPVKPQIPFEPRFTEVLPQQPVYKTAGMFNKKKIAAENEAIKNAYEAELERYKQREAAFQSELETYKNALAQYETAEAAWSAEVELINKKAQTEYQTMVAQKEREYNEKVSELRRKKQEAEAKRKQIVDSLVLGGTIDEQAGMQLLAEEISEGEKLLESIISARNELYSYNVIYPKYRNFVALSSFYDYLMSGRCNALVGSDGAYNLYENESRADLIITQLSDVLTSLERIQDNQYMLYQQMSEVNNGVKSLNESMTSVVSSLAHLEMTGEEMKKSLKSISSDTASMNKEVKSIAENAEITAHYSKVSAFYAKKNAELTDALGYMTAFK